MLHTEEYEESLHYKEYGGDKPFTKLDKIQEIWEKVLPHRKLKKEAGVIKTYPSDNSDSIYNSSEMSDGERVIFYLIGEVMCVPKNSIIIIDEPEMHLHKSLVNKLFNLIENAREDCCFIYLTHDIDFAITRQNAKKIWMKSYEGNDTWDYEILENNEAIPESLYLEVLGSRKPILFIEGENKSFDYKLYQYIFPDYTIKSLGSCTKVIEIVKSFNEQSSFHNIKAYGLIDRDRRNKEEIEKLNSKDIWVLDVAEVENLFLEENVIKEIASHMGKNSDNVLKEVGENIYSFFEKEIENQIRLKFKEVIQKRFYELTQKMSNDEDFIKLLDSNYNTINKEEIYAYLIDDYGISTDISNRIKNITKEDLNIKRVLAMTVDEYKQHFMLDISNEASMEGRLVTNAFYVICKGSSISEIEAPNAEEIRCDNCHNLEKITAENCIQVWAMDSNIKEKNIEINYKGVIEGPELQKQLKL